MGTDTIHDSGSQPSVAARTEINAGTEADTDLFRHTSSTSTLREQLLDNPDSDETLLIQASHESLRLFDVGLFDVGLLSSHHRAVTGSEPTSTAQVPDETPSLIEQAASLLTGRITAEEENDESNVDEPEQPKSLWQRMADSTTGWLHSMTSWIPWGDYIAAAIGRAGNSNSSPAVPTDHSLKHTRSKRKSKPLLNKSKDPTCELGEDHARLLQPCEAHRLAKTFEALAIRLRTEGSSITTDTAILERLQKRLALFTEVLHSYADGVRVKEHQEQESEKRLAPIEEFDEREGAVELVEFLIAGAEDHPELIRYLHDDYMEGVPISTLIELVESLEEQHHAMLSVFPAG